MTTKHTEKRHIEDPSQCGAEVSWAAARIVAAASNSYIEP